MSLVWKQRVDTYTIAANADDWDDSGDSSTTLTAVNNQRISPPDVGYAYIDIDTHLLGDSEPILQMEFNWYDHSYTTLGKPAPTHHRAFEMYNHSALTWQLFYSYTGTLASGWKDTVVTDAVTLSNIDRTGKTHVRMLIDDPPIFTARFWRVRAKDYAGSYGAYIRLWIGLPTTRILILGA